MKSAYPGILKLCLFIVGFALTACTAPSQDEPVIKIGIINYTSIFDPLVEGFKAGMADAGYVEGKNIVYFYDGLMPNDNAAIDQEIQKLLKQDPDLFLTLGSVTTLRIKDVLETTNKVALFSPVANPDRLGLVQDLSKPGGRMTGISLGKPYAEKGLEWFLTAVPSVKRVHSYYRSTDPTAPTLFSFLQETAEKLNVEIVFHKIESGDDIVADLPSLSSGTDAVLFIPSPIFTPSEQAAYIQAATQRGIPVGAVTIGGVANGELTGLTVDYTQMGAQTAQMALEILHGADPGTLPVRPVQFTQALNLATANALGITIPDSVLQQASLIVRDDKTP
jgi:putative ABC transport system substrate-binding protein